MAQFQLLICHSFLFILTSGPTFIAKAHQWIVLKWWMLRVQMGALLGFLQKNMGDPYYEPTIVVHNIYLVISQEPGGCFSKGLILIIIIIHLKRIWLSSCASTWQECKVLKQQEYIIIIVRESVQLSIQVYKLVVVNSIQQLFSFYINSYSRVKDLLIGVNGTTYSCEWWRQQHEHPQIIE